MVRTKLVLCAERILRDQPSNNVSIIDVLEEINAVSFPLIISRFAVLWVTERDAADPEVIESTILISLGDQELARIPQSINFQGVLRSRSILNIQGFLLPRPGKLKFDFMIGSAVQATYEVDAHAVEAPEQVQIRQRGGAEEVAPPPP